ncbi:MAG TPA: SGNH/GDSL hydrolase family protein [Rhizomicrobium sp.]|nr:SGNH/GDSL hydrolase family protein [Rhizomicrobium sp.]
MQDELGPTAMMDNPCPPDLVRPPQLAIVVEALLKPGRIGPEILALFAEPQMQAYTKAQTERAATDWPNLCRYRSANAALTGAVRIVFMGNSITENWVNADPEFFTGGVVGRGISGQTSPQMLLRFYDDVIALKPRIVHILGGGNDVAGNTGPSRPQDYKNNFMAMIQLAQANGIKVLIGSITPAGRMHWKPEYRPAQTIIVLNTWLREYAREQGLTYIDYHTALADGNGAFRKELANDGVHPNRDGYAIMTKLASAAIAASE